MKINVKDWLVSMLKHEDENIHISIVADIEMLF